MSAADDAREWLKVALSFTEGRRHVVALLAQFDQAQVVAKWLIAETEYKSDAYSVRQEAKTLRQRDEARDDIKRARAALDELVSHGDLTPSGRRVLRSILGGDS